MEQYIELKSAIKSLKQAEIKHEAVFIMARTFFGKTTLVKQYLKEKDFTYISCADGYPELPDYNDTKKIIVFDDLQFAKSLMLYEFIQRAINDSNKQLYIISRGQLPDELLFEFLSKRLCTLTEKEIGATLSDALEYCGNNDILIDDETLSDMLMRAQGSPSVLAYFIRAYASGETDLSGLYKKADQMLKSLVVANVFSQWDAELAETMMKLSIVDSFDLDFAEIITGNSSVNSILLQAQSIGSFLRLKDGIYSFEPYTKSVLFRRFCELFPLDKIRQVQSNAALYYEMHNELSTALTLYKESKNDEKVKELLVRNGRKAVADAHLFELRHFYLSLSEDEVAKNCILMQSLSELHSIMLQTEKSEYWYSRLEEFANKAVGREKREANECLLYLDLCLPHRSSSSDYVKIIKKLPAAVFDKGMKMPSFNPTSNLPGIMNGGLDFSDWSKNDKLLANTIGWILEKGFYKGTVNVALGESQYEKGEDIYYAISLLSKGQFEANGSDALPLLFASVGIQARANASLGELEIALGMMTAFEKRVHSRNEVNLYGNVAAIICRLHLLKGDLSFVRKWIADTPDENDDFNSIDRYIYLTKVRAYIALGDLTSAFALLEKMLFYTSKFRRICMKIEANILMAILNNKLHRDYMDNLIEALKIASEYHFVRIISEEGTAVIGLLKQMDSELRANPDIDNKWLDLVFRETSSMAIYYPTYLASSKINPKNFCENALKILEMQAKGFSNAEIAKTLGVSVDNIKYHTKQNYKKLGVNSKAEAIIYARELKLI